jgi:DnaJ-class molecular chaperone
MRRLESLRSRFPQTYENEVHGILDIFMKVSGAMVEQAFTGFVALPAPKSPWDVLGVQPGASQEEIETAFRAKAKKLHSDHGSGADAMMAG